MPKATFNGTVIAESDNTQVVEGNHYFPPDSVNRDYLTEHDLKTNCPWKGEASYMNVEVDGKVADHAAWYYPTTKDAAKDFEGYFAFWNGVEVTD